jgi:hypothetical protein
MVERADEEKHIITGMLVTTLKMGRAQGGTSIKRES